MFAVRRRLERSRLRRDANRRRRRLERERLDERLPDLSDEEELELLDVVADESASERRRLRAMRDLGLISRREHEQHLRPIIAAEVEAERALGPRE